MNVTVDLASSVQEVNLDIDNRYIIMYTVLRNNTHYTHKPLTADPLITHTHCGPPDYSHTLVYSNSFIYYLKKKIL